MKDCVLFAAWCPYLHRMYPYIQILKKCYSNCDIFVGVNPNTKPEFIKLLNDNSINNIIHVNPSQEVNSDASAFQAALKLYKNSSKDYRYVYFLHTKGMSYKSEEQWKTSRESYFDSFANRRLECEKLLSPDDVGGCGLVANFCWSLYNSDYIKYVTKFINPPHNQVQNVMWLTTNYAIKNDAVKYFVDNCKEEFFNVNLGDRYFFESSFPMIVELLSNKKRESCVYWDDNLKDNYDRMINDWNTRRNKYV